MSVFLPPSLRTLEKSLLPRLGKWSRELLMAGAYHEIDPFLLAAIMDRESMGGQALSQDGTGDHGHGRGLMQIDDRAHGSFCMAVDDRGIYLWKLPLFNVMYAAQLLKRNFILFGGNEPCAVAAYNAGAGNVKKVLVALGQKVGGILLPALDGITANHNYVSDVLERREKFRDALK